MLQFVLGANGFGKTTHIYREIESLVNSGNDKIIMIVPDQISFETEKDFLDILGPKNSKNVKVFGFSRLCHYIFELTANYQQNVMDKGTREVVMNIAIDQLSEKLTLLSSKNTKSNTALMLGVLSDCKKNNISTEMLRLASVKLKNETLKTKLIESALVLDTYDSIVSQSYVDPLDDLARLYEILENDSTLLQGYSLFIDSFSDFTSQQLRVIRLLMNRCKKTTVAIAIDNSSIQDELFEVSNKTYSALKRIAQQDFINIKPPIKLSECKKFNSDELVALEKNIFRKTINPSNIEPSRICLYSADSIYAECEFVARQIKKQIIYNGKNYSDFVVICHDLDDYQGVLNVVLDKYEIPYFMDDNRDIEVMPSVRLINSIFRIVLDNYNADDVVSLLKTGLTANTQDEISIFENYCFVWNINNSRFKSEFTNNPQGFSDSFSDTDKANLEIAEKVRKSIILPLEKFRKSISDKTGREISELLYMLLCDLEVQNSLSELYNNLQLQNQKFLGDEQIRIWGMLMNAIDKTVAVTSEMALSPRRYFELLSIQINAIEFSQIPQTLDSVTVTTAQRVRASDNKVSFLIGCTDGKFPAYPQSKSFFTDTEMKLLIDSDIRLGVDSSYLAQLDLFQAYCSVTSPSEELYLSFPLMSESGDKFSPSSLITDIEKIFPKIKYYDTIDASIQTADSMLAIKPAFEAFASSLSKGSRELSGLREFFKSNDDYSSKTTAVLRSLDQTPFTIDNKANAKSLFGDNLTISASQIQKFSLCRFSYFCEYGLRVRKRTKAEMNPLEYGTLVHYMLEKFFNQYSKNEYLNLSDSVLKDFASSTINEYLSSHFGGSEQKTGEFLYRLTVVSENIVMLLKNIISELSQSDFYVSDCELGIGSDIPAYTISLPTGENISVFGSIDRVDVMDLDGEKYIRIIDYKTGHKSFKLSEVLYGLNLQMLLYLYALKQNGKGKFGDFSPAGILYKPATINIISASSQTPLSDSKLDSEINKTLRANGLLLDDIEVLKGMEHSLKGVYIPVSVTQSNAYTKYSYPSLATLSQFGAIFEKIDSIILSMGMDIYSGNVSASPITDNIPQSLDSCTFCEYATVCAYRREPYRNAFILDNKRVFEELEKAKKEAEE